MFRYQLIVDSKDIGLYNDLSKAKKHGEELSKNSSIESIEVIDREDFDKSIGYIRNSGWVTIIIDGKPLSKLEF